MTVHLIGLILLAAATLIAWDFIINYGLRANWRSHPYGRITLLFKTTTALILTVSIINGFFLRYPGRTVLGLLAFAAFVGAFLMQDIFLRRQLRREKEEHQEKEEENVV